jgi:prophage maintenance system killer protein
LNGNKRTAVLAARVFLHLNGYVLDAEQGELVQLALHIETGTVDIAAIAAQLKGWTREIRLPEEG